MPKFTKGPWKATTSRLHRRQISGDNGKQIALMWKYSNGESYANECLITAAPDLYEAVIALLLNEPGAIEMANEALNKAGG